MNIKSIKTGHLIFLLCVSAIIAAFSIAPTSEIADGITITRKQNWEMGFAPSFIALGALLGVASVAAWRGSALAFKFCLYWAGLYSVVIGGIAIWHFPTLWGYAVGFGIAWSAAWFYSIRKWYV